MAQQKELTQIYGFGHSQASKAAWANRKVEKSAQSAILSEKEESALLRYFSGESYTLNSKLRQGLELEPYEEELMYDIDAALYKLPKYTGKVIRDLIFDYFDDEKEFENLHGVGTIVTYPTFTSSSTLDSYQDNPIIRLSIKSKNGKDLRKYNFEEGEILFQRNSRFFIQNKYRKNGMLIIEMEELYE